jgi:hypothetical protein
LTCRYQGDNVNWSGAHRLLDSGSLKQALEILRSAMVVREADAGERLAEAQVRLVDPLGCQEANERFSPDPGEHKERRALHTGGLISEERPHLVAWML